MDKKYEQTIKNEELNIIIKISTLYKIPWLDLKTKTRDKTIIAQYYDTENGEYLKPKEFADFFEEAIDDDDRELFYSNTSKEERTIFANWLKETVGTNTEGVYWVRGEYYDEWIEPNP